MNTKALQVKLVMKIALVNLPMNERKCNRKDRQQKYGGIGNHLGLGYIGALVQAQGDEVTLFDCPNDDILLGELLERLHQELYDVIGITLYHTGRVMLARLLAGLRYSPFIVLGGHYASMVPQELLRSFPKIDVIVIGEGEIAFCELINKLKRKENWENIDGIAYLKEGKYIQNPKGILVENLDTLPFPLRNIIKGQKVTPVVASRGCNEHCIFCDVWVFQRKNCGTPFRFRSPENVASEIISLAKHGLKYFDLIDDNFLAIESIQPGWIDTFVKIIKDAKLDIKLEINTRADLITEEILVKLKSIGLHEVGFGAENICQRVLDYFNKNLTVDQVRKCFDIIRKTGLVPGPSFIFFEPTTRKEELLENIRFLREIGMDDFSNGIPFSMYRPLVLEPSTPVYEKFKKEGKLKPYYPGYDFENEDVRLIWELINSFRDDTIKAFNAVQDSEETIMKLIYRDMDIVENIITNINDQEYCKNIIEQHRRWIYSHLLEGRQYEHTVN